MSISMINLRIAFAFALAAMIGWGCSTVGGLPAMGEFSISLLQQPSPAWAFVVAAVAFLSSLLLAIPLTSSINRDTPIACGAASLAVISMRGGSGFYVLTHTAEPSTYLLLAVETVLLFALIGVGGWIAHWLARPSVITRPSDDREPEPLDQRLLAGLIAAFLMAAVLFVLSKNSAKQQALGSLVGAGVAAGWLGFFSVPTRPAGWFLLGGLIVALLGYLTGYYSPAMIHIGEPGHYFAALARPLPIDYASAGVMGTIWGYSIGRRGPAAGEDTDTSPARGKTF